jgi:hypothetical protein
VHLARQHHKTVFFCCCDFTRVERLARFPLFSRCVFYSIRRVLQHSSQALREAEQSRVKSE